MPVSIREIMKLYAQDIKALFGTHLKQIMVYGSYARGDYHENSDIDVMILTDIDENVISKYRDIASDCAFDYLMKYGVDISPVVKNADHFEHWKKTVPYYQNVEKEGIRIDG